MSVAQEYDVDITQYVSLAVKTSQTTAIKRDTDVFVGT